MHLLSRLQSNVQKHAMEERINLQCFEPACAPGLELLPDLLGVAVGRHDDVHMVRPAIDCVESPSPHPAMIGNGRFDEPGAGPGREDRHLPSCGREPRVCERDREAASRGGTRPTRAHRRAARCRTLARSENRPRDRAKAVRSHVSSLLFCESRAWSIGVPSQNVTQQLDAPATGSSACNPACCRLSHVTDHSDAPARVPRHSPRWPSEYRVLWAWLIL